MSDLPKSIETIDAIDVILRTALDAVVVADAEGRVVAVNDTACAIFQRDRAAFVGRTIAETIVPQVHRAAHDAGMARYTATGEARVVGRRIEIDALRACGAAFPVELAITELEAQGARYFVSYLRDISERKAAEQALEAARVAAEEADAAKARLVAMISHDLRNPVNSVVGALNLALQAPDPADTRIALENASRAASAMRVLLEDLLSLSQLDAGALQLNPTPTELQSFFREVIEHWTPRAAAKRIAFSLRLAPDRRRNVMMDRLRLRQVLDNLIGNAVKFTDAGGVSVQAGWVDEQRFGVCVEDTGVGLGDFDPEIAFAPFKRSSERRDGAGLGLWIVKSLVELHGGDVRLEPRPGGGARALVEIPMERTPIGAVWEIEREKLHGLRVLLVDDNETNRFVSEHFLSDLGCHVSLSVNGREACAAADAGGFDLILMDLDMPVMNGFDAIASIRASDAIREQPVILALTAYSTGEHRARLRALGADGLIPKPLQSPDELARALLPHLTPSATACAPAAAAPAAEGGAAVLDAAALGMLAEAIGPEEMTSLASKVIADISGGADEVERWAPTYEIDRLRRATHMLDAVAGTIGAFALQSRAAALNAACHAVDRSAIDRHAPVLVSLAAETLDAFDHAWRAHA